MWFMAYPNGGINNDERVANIIRNNTGIHYARTITSTYSFDMPNNLYRYNPTICNREWDKLWKLVEKFIDLHSDKPALLYIWGHSYEFDYEDSWEKFEELCKTLGNRKDIYYGTNREVLL